MEKKIRLLNGCIAGAIVAAIFIVIFTIVGELYKPLKDLLKDQHYHHWIGKGVWATITFFITAIVYFFAAHSPHEQETDRLLNILSWTLALSLVVLLGFFTYEYFIHL